MKRKFSLLVASVFMATMGLAGCIKKCEHTYVETITTAATCTEVGVKTFTCSNCNDSYTEDIAALGHDLIIDGAVAPTCGTEGHEAGKHCSRCDYKEGGAVIAATGDHNLVSNEDEVAATCTTAGHGPSYHCSNCDYVKAGETIAPTGTHTPDDYGFCADCNVYLGGTATIGSNFSLTGSGKHYFKITFSIAKDYNFIFSGKTPYPLHKTLKGYHYVDGVLVELVNDFNTSFHVDANETVYVVVEHDGANEFYTKPICKTHNCNDYGDCLDCLSNHWHNAKTAGATKGENNYWRFSSNEMTRVNINIVKQYSTTTATIVKVIKLNETTPVTADSNGFYPVDPNSTYCVTYTVPSTGTYTYAVEDYSDLVGVISDVFTITGRGTVIIVPEIFKGFASGATIYLKVDGVYTGVMCTGIQVNSKVVATAEVGNKDVQLLLRGVSKEQITLNTYVYTSNPTA